MLLLVIFTRTEYLAVPILILKNMGILLTLKPRVLQVEQYGSPFLVLLDH